MSWQTSSRSNRVSFWFLIILGILAVAAVGLVLYRFNGDMRGNFFEGKNNNKNDEERTVPLADAMTEEVLMGWKRDEKNRIVITGKIANVQPIPEQKDVKGMELELLVSPTVDPAIYAAPDKVYRFFLSERDTEGFFEGMKQGDELSITAQSAPMDDAYVIAAKVEKMNEKSSANGTMN